MFRATTDGFNDRQRRSGGSNGFEAGKRARDAEPPPAPKRRKRAPRLVGEHACVMCKKGLQGIPYLNPGKCMQKYGAPTAHRVCEDCWFGHFVPGADHRCPGCVTGTPLPAAPPARSVEVYDEVL